MSAQTTGKDWASAVARLLCVPIGLLLAGCALATPGAPTPVPTADFSVVVDILVTVNDEDTDEPIIVDRVWLDNEIIYRRVSRFLLILPGRYPPTQDGYEIRIQAEGYALWTTRVRPRTNRPRNQTLTVHLHRLKGQTFHQRSVTSPAGHEIRVPSAVRIHSAPVASTVSAMPTISRSPTRARTAFPSV